MVVLLLVLVYATVVAPPVLASDSCEVVVGDDFLLFVVSGMLPDAIFGIEDHVAVLHDAMVVVGVVVVALFAATVLLTHELAVLPPEVLAVPVGLLLHEVGVTRRQIYGGLALFVADRGVPLAQALRVGHVGGAAVLAEHGQVETFQLLFVLAGEGWVDGAVLQALHHALGQFVLPVGQLGVLAFVFPLVGEELTGTVEDVAALGADAVDVVADFGEAAFLERAHFVLHELLEAVAGQLLVFDVVGFVLFCKKWQLSETFRRMEKTLGISSVKLRLTHIGLVLEGEPTARPPAVEVRGSLSEEGAVRGAALFRRPVPLEALLYDGGVLPVVVGVHLDVRRRDVYFITAFLDAMIVCLLLVVGAVAEAVAAVVQRAVPHEAVLERLVALLVPLEVPYHLLLLDEDARVAVEAVEVLPGRGLIVVGPRRRTVRV
jgi:hypothetical protein